MSAPRKLGKRHGLKQRKPVSTRNLDALTARGPEEQLLEGIKHWPTIAAGVGFADQAAEERTRTRNENTDVPLILAATLVNGADIVEFGLKASAEDLLDFGLGLSAGAVTSHLQNGGCALRRNEDVVARLVFRKLAEKFEGEAGVCGCGCLRAGCGCSEGGGENEAAGEGGKTAGCSRGSPHHSLEGGGLFSPTEGGSPDGSSAGDGSAGTPSFGGGRQMLVLA